LETGKADAIRHPPEIPTNLDTISAPSRAVYGRWYAISGFPPVGGGEIKHLLRGTSRHLSVPPPLDPRISARGGGWG